MKHILLLLLILIFILPTPAQWQLVGPPGGRVWHVAVDPKFPEIVYASSDGGLFKTTDGGATTKLLDGPASFILIDPVNTNIIYSGVSKSTDQGETWRRIEFPVYAINPVNSNHVYSVSSEPNNISRLLASYDAGETWSTNYVFNTNSGSLSIAHSDTNIFYCFSHDSGTGVYKSTNAGRTWRKTSFQLLPRDIFMDMTINPLNPQTVFVGTKDYGVYKTIDGGNSWTYILSTAWVQEIAINPVDTSIIYVVTGDYLTGYVGNVFKTTNGGNSWTIMNNGLPSDYNRYIYAIDINQLQPEEVYIGTYGFGVYKTTNGGQRWQWTNISPAPVLDIYCDPINKGHIYAGTWDQGILKTTDTGRTWARLDFGVPRTVQTFFRQYAINPNNQNVHYAAGGTYGLFKSTDSGLNWQLTSLQGSFDTFVWSIAIHPTNSESLFIGQTGWLARDLYRSTDAAVTFENLHLINGTGSIEIIRFDPQNHNIIYVCAGESGLFKTTNGGDNWFNADSGLIITDPPLRASVNSIDINQYNTDILYVCQSAAGSNKGGLLQSTSGGLSWFRIDSSIAPMEKNLKFQDVHIFPLNPSWLLTTASAHGQFATFSPGGVFLSTNNGITWQRVRTGSSFDIEFDPFNPHRIYIATWAGIYTTTDSVLLSVNDIKSIPTETILYQNYPNPFNSTTIIRYAVKTSATASIRIFNILGKEVKSFQVNHAKPGEYEIIWDGTDKNGFALPSGVYFFRMQTNNFIAVKKMLMIK